jgi:O-antigen/teichoic acid export membrane protein
VSSVRKSLLLSFAERYSTLLINVAATMIVARLLTPAEIGLFSVVYGIVNIAQSLRDFGVLHYVVQEEDLTRVRLRTALGFALATGLLATAIFVGLAGPLASFFHEPRMYQLVLILSLGFIGVSVGSIGLARLRRRMDFPAIMRISICQALVHAGSSVVLASSGFGAIGMAWASVLGIWVGALGPYIYFPRDIFMLPSFKAYRRVMDFGVFVSGANLLGEMTARAPDIIIGRLLGFAQAGFYSRGNGMITLLDQALMGAITSVAVSAMAAVNRAGEDTRNLFLRFLGSTTAAAWPFLGMMAMLSLPMIQIFFGSQWLPAVPVARILCVGAAFLVVGQIGGVLLLACGAARRTLAIQLVSVPFQLAAVAIGALFDIESVAVGFAVANIISAVITLLHVERLIGPVLKQVFRELTTSALVTVSSLAVPAAVQLFYGITLDHLWVPTLVAGFGGAAGWLACIFAIGHPLADEIRLLLAKLGSAGPWAARSPALAAAITRTPAAPEADRDERAEFTR